MSLLQSNRDRAVKPKKMAKLSDLEKPVKKEKAKPEKEERVTLTISKQTKKRLQAMVLLGDADNQKDGFDIAMQVYYEHLPEDKKSMFDILYNSLEHKTTK